jgi:hypothetical protein
MESWAIEFPVEVRDNGVRSFIPPCFCFELRDASGNVVATVSEVVLEVPGQAEQVRDFDAVGFLDRNGLLALGNISEYNAGPQAREPGRRFSVTGLVLRSSAPGWS